MPGHGPLCGVEGPREMKAYLEYVRSESKRFYEAIGLAQQLAEGPSFAHMITKTQLNQEWSMSLEQAIEAEAQAQAICMQSADFERAYHAFVDKRKPRFEGD